MKIIKNLFRVQYRLTTIIRGQSQPKHFYGTDRSKLKRMAKSRKDVNYWAIYKRGPFGLPEREVDAGMKGGDE
jgi:hypothetical protein